MIRFVDLRKADIVHGRFAFFDTIPDRFIEMAGEQTWNTFQQFKEDYNNDPFKHDRQKTQPLERFKGLCPTWVLNKSHYQKF